MAARRLLIPAALALVGCFPEFAEWRSEGATSSATGGAASSSSSTGGAGGMTPTCEDLGGTCLAPAPGGFKGPARLSNMGCGGDAQTLAVGNAVAMPITTLCQFEALPEECGNATVHLSNGGNCEAFFPFNHQAAQTPMMNACSTLPPTYATFKLTGPSTAQCKQVGALPFLTFEGELDLCAAASTCMNGDACAPAGAQFCIWNEDTPEAACPPDYPQRKEQKTATAMCAPFVVDCAPNLVFAADCSLATKVATVPLADDTCRPLPANAPNWALEPGTVESCGEVPATAAPVHSITLCCTSP